MSSNLTSPDSGSREFLAAVAGFVASFDWQPRSFERDDEVVAVIALDQDPLFEQLLWVYDTSREFVRCLLIARGSVPKEREAAVLELCARINDGIVFGCAEYSFDDRTLLFRDAFQVVSGKWPELVALVGARVLEFGSHYSPAILQTLAGIPAVDAINRLEGN